MTRALLLQISSLVQPLHLAPEPPELRAARNVLLVYAETEEGPARPRLPADETFALAPSIVARARAGEPVQLEHHVTGSYSAQHRHPSG
jgi:hypothetical protein